MGRLRERLVLLREPLRRGRPIRRWFPGVSQKESRRGCPFCSNSSDLDVVHNGDNARWFALDSFRELVYERAKVELAFVRDVGDSVTLYRKSDPRAWSDRVKSLTVNDLNDPHKQPLWKGDHALLLMDYLLGFTEGPGGNSLLPRLRWQKRKRMKLRELRLGLFLLFMRLMTGLACEKSLLRAGERQDKTRGNRFAQRALRWLLAEPEVLFAELAYRFYEPCSNQKHADRFRIVIAEWPGEGKPRTRRPKTIESPEEWHAMKSGREGRVEGQRRRRSSGD